MTDSIRVHRFDDKGTPTNEIVTLQEAYKNNLPYGEARLAVLDAEGDILQHRDNATEPWDPFLISTPITTDDNNEPMEAILRRLERLGLSTTTGKLLAGGLMRTPSTAVCSTHVSTLHGTFHPHSVFGHNFIVRIDDVTAEMFDDKAGLVRAYAPLDLSRDVIRPDVVAYREHLHRPDAAKGRHDGDIYGPLLTAIGQLAAVLL